MVQKDSPVCNQKVVLGPKLKIMTPGKGDESEETTF